MAGIAELQPVELRVARDIYEEANLLFTET